MHATVYTKDNCPYCTKVKTVLESLGVTLTTYNLDNDFTREQFYAEFGEGSTFPQVVIDEEVIGGCTETVKYLRDQKLV